MSNDLLDEIETIARAQVDTIKLAVKNGYACDFEDIRKLELLTRMIATTRQEARRVAKDHDMSAMSDAELEEMLKK